MSISLHAQSLPVTAVRRARAYQTSLSLHLQGIPRSSGLHSAQRRWQHLTHVSPAGFVRLVWIVKAMPRLSWPGLLLRRTVLWGMRPQQLPAEDEAQIPPLRQSLNYLQWNLLFKNLTNAQSAGLSYIPSFLW